MDAAREGLRRRAPGCGEESCAEARPERPTTPGLEWEPPLRSDADGREGVAASRFASGPTGVPSTGALFRSRAARSCDAISPREVSAPREGRRQPSWRADSRGGSRPSACDGREDIATEEGRSPVGGGGRLGIFRSAIGRGAKTTTENVRRRFLPVPRRAFPRAHSRPRARVARSTRPRRDRAPWRTNAPRPSSPARRRGRAARRAKTPTERSLGAVEAWIRKYNERRVSPRRETRRRRARASRLRGTRSLPPPRRERALSIPP